MLGNLWNTCRCAFPQCLPDQYPGTTLNNFWTNFHLWCHIPPLRPAKEIGCWPVTNVDVGTQEIMICSLLRYLIRMRTFKLRASWLARFPRSRIATLFFVKIPMCLFEKPGWPSVTGMKIFPYEHSSRSDRVETFFVSFAFTTWGPK